MSNPTFTNEREMYDVEHTNGTINVTGSIRVKVENKQVEELSGGIMLAETGAQIGAYNLMSVQIYDIANIQYRTAASELVDEILAAALTQIQTLDNGQEG